METKIVISCVDGHCSEFGPIDHYSEYNGFLEFTCKNKFPSGRVITNINKINLRNIVGYTISVIEEDENNG